MTLAKACNNPFAHALFAIGEDGIAQPSLHTMLIWWLSLWIAGIGLYMLSPLGPGLVIAAVVWIGRDVQVLMRGNVALSVSLHAVQKKRNQGSSAAGPSSELDLNTIQSRASLTTEAGIIRVSVVEGRLCFRLERDTPSARKLAQFLATLSSYCANATTRITFDPRTSRMFAQFEHPTTACEGTVEMLREFLLERFPDWIPFFLESAQSAQAAQAAPVVRAVPRAASNLPELSAQPTRVPLTEPGHALMLWRTNQGVHARVCRGDECGMELVYRNESAVQAVWGHLLVGANPS